MSHLNKDSDLVLGLVTTIGTDTKIVIDRVVDYLKKFGYITCIINVSSDIMSMFKATPPDFNNEYQRISHYMNLGNELRTMHNNDILMQGSLTKIYREREELNKRDQTSRKAFIINSIKHPDEVEFLRTAYGQGFHLIGITSSFQRRKEYLIKRKLLNQDQATQILRRDENETDGHGQHTRDTYQEADYFLSIDENTDLLENNVFRLIDLLFGNPYIFPTFDEYAMFKAYTASLRSADLSRQIGAVVTINNEIISEGVNDCPKAFGGLYWTTQNANGEFVDEDNGRDYKIKQDTNKIEQQQIATRVLSNLNIEINETNVKAVLNAGIKSLTEYGRVVHGEMEALMMCARNNISCRNGIMYVTTFPCHNCAKHIIAAGIKKVVYIEPYPKSKALEFYTNEITQNESENDKKVLFIAFTGVGPHKFIDLFSLNSIQWYDRIRKDDTGKTISWDPAVANLRNPLIKFNYIDYEQAAIKNLYEKEKMTNGNEKICNVQ